MISVKFNMLIKSGGGTGPVKPDNLLSESKVPNPADEIFYALGFVCRQGVFCFYEKCRPQGWGSDKREGEKNE